MPFLELNVVGLGDLSIPGRTLVYAFTMTER